MAKPMLLEIAYARNDARAMLRAWKGLADVRKRQQVVTRERRVVEAGEQEGQRNLRPGRADHIRGRGHAS